jgi:hypothetical protein
MRFGEVGRPPRSGLTGAAMLKSALWAEAGFDDRGDPGKSSATHEH